ncbi:topology modulation protein [compost metagenome]
MAEGCREKIDLEFLKWIWNFRKRNRGVILEKLSKAKEQKQIYIFKKSKEATDYLAKIRLEKGSMNE